MKLYYVVSSFGAERKGKKLPLAIVVLTESKIVNLAFGEMSANGTTLQAVAFKYGLPISLHPTTHQPNKLDAVETFSLSTFALKCSWQVFEVFEMGEEEALIIFARKMGIEDQAIEIITDCAI